MTVTELSVTLRETSARCTWGQPSFLLIQLFNQLKVQ